MNLKEQLIEKMEAEFEHFHSWLLEQPPEEILDLAYDYLTKQDIRTHCLLFPEPQISLFGKLPTSLRTRLPGFLRGALTFNLSPPQTASAWPRTALLWPRPAGRALRRSRR